ncbi:putative ribonuclease h protein [Quercus suber]|uniref:Ribonuclease h protein n=1 Tax=Quercus suber TaxID=58331 RepID=A0AAW0KGK7_QUESU
MKKKEDEDLIFCETPLLAHTGLAGIHKLPQLYLYRMEEKDQQENIFLLGISNLEVELDAKAIVEMINNANSSNKKLFPLLLDCRSLMEKLAQVRVAHVFREANRCADYLAKFGCCMREDFVIYDAAPCDELDSLLNFDRNGLYSYRQVASTLAVVASL